MSKGNHVFKWSPKTNTTTGVTGEITHAELTGQILSEIQDVYINQIDGSIYVVDTYRHRIKKWSMGAEIGATVAGSNLGLHGTDAASLHYPSALLVDDETQVVYVLDTNNQRLQRWLFNASEGETIVGGYGLGNSDRELNTPRDFDFDNEGNLYVCDTNNHRIQMFAIIDNQPCSAISTSNSAHLKTTPRMQTTPPVLTTTSKTPPSTTTTVITSPLATTTIKSHAASSYSNCYYTATLTIFLWIISMLL